MWIATEPNPAKVMPMPREWLRGSALKIFQGESTCCQRHHVGVDRCDRELLVEPVLGLYGRLYARAKVARERHGSVQSLSARRRHSSMTDDGLEAISIFDLKEWKKESSNQPNEANEAELQTYALLESLESLIFPSSFQYTCSMAEDGADQEETRELFGTLVSLMKLIIDDDRSLQYRLNRQQSRLINRRNNFDDTLHNQPRKRGKRFSLSRLLTGEATENASTFQLTEDNLRLSEQHAQLKEGSIHPALLAAADCSIHPSLLAAEGGTHPSLQCGMAQAQTRASQNEESSCTTCTYSATHCASAFAGHARLASNSDLRPPSAFKYGGNGCEDGPRRPSLKRQQSGVSISEHLEVVNSKNVMERRRRCSATHEGIFQKHGRRLSLGKPADLQKAQVNSARVAKLAHRWSFPGHYELARAGHDAHFASAQMAVTASTDAQVKVGIGLDDRLTFAASITLARRRAAWLDGEKEFTANSSRHQSYSHRARDSARGGTTWHGRRLSRWLQDHKPGFRGRVCSYSSRQSQSTLGLSEESQMRRQDQWRETAKRAEQAKSALGESFTKLSLKISKPNLLVPSQPRTSDRNGRRTAMGLLRRSSCRSSTRSRTGSVESISDDHVKRLSASQLHAERHTIVLPGARKVGLRASSQAPAGNGCCANVV